MTPTIVRRQDVAYRMRSDLARQPPPQLKSQMREEENAVERLLFERKREMSYLLPVVDCPCCQASFFRR